MNNPLPSINPSVEIDRITSLIKTSFSTAHKSTAIIGLSGGIDSAVSLALTVQALGPDHIQAFCLPARTSNPIHLSDAKLAAASLPESHFHILPIGSIIQKEWRVIHRHAGPDPATIQINPGSRVGARDDARLRLANLAARTRMLILFDQAKAFDGLVIGTENRSETDLGYFTRFGDAASDIEPIAHLYKTYVYQLAQALHIPQALIDKAPSADLWHGQTDAQELGFSYADADPILYLLDNHQTADQIKAAGFDPQLVDAVISHVNRAAFKQQVPYKLNNK